MLEQLAIQKLMNQSFVELRLKNSAFSLRAFAQKLELAPSAVSEIMKGKRKVSIKMAEKIAEKLNISPLEKVNILALFQGRPVDDEQANALSALNEKFIFYSKWHHQGILALIETGDFVADSAWIARRLNIKPIEASEGLNRLEALGLIAKNLEGVYTLRASYSAAADQAIDELASAHQRHLQHAIEESTLAFNRAKPKTSYFATHILPIHPSQLQLVKDKMDAFAEDLKKTLAQSTSASDTRSDAPFEAPSQATVQGQRPEEVIRLNLQVYQISARPESSPIMGDYSEPDPDEATSHF